MSDTWEIRSKFGIENPQDVRMSLAVTARLKDWISLRDDLRTLKQGNMVYELGRQIDALVAQAHASFTERSPE